MEPSSFLIRLARILILLGVGVIAAFALAVVSPHLLTMNPDRPGCDTPIPYRVEASDPRFPLDSSAFRRGVFKAELLWEQAIGKDLFTYDQTASLVIRTEFDERQKMTSEAEKLEQEVSAYEASAEKIKVSYDSTSTKYEKAQASFKSTADIFNRKLADYNADVKKWNASGSGTPEEYEKLENRRKKLEKEERALVADSKNINALAEDVNTLARKLNKSTTDINQNVTTFRERYGEPKPFIQGLYDGAVPSVTIFQFKDQGDLLLVLAHELGHALGIEEHVPSEASLMHSMMGGQDLDQPTLSAEDKAAYAAVCPERLFSKPEALIRYLTSRSWAEVALWDMVSILAR